MRAAPMFRLRDLLSHPFLFRAFRALLVRRDYTGRIQEHLRSRRGDRVLDVGCGTGGMLLSLPDVDYVGFDAHPGYVAAAQRIFGSRGRFFCHRLGSDTPESLGEFDLVVAGAVLHHLDDGEVLSLFRLAERVLRRGGRVVTIDPCYSEGQSRVARFIISRDRGRFVRDAAGYTTLAARVFADVGARVRHDLLRVPYTHVVIEGTKGGGTDANGEGRAG